MSVPTAEDALDVHALISRCPPLDPNSAYCNLLQCVHFASTAVIGRIDGRIVGWISAHLLPSDPRTLFVWQIAVAEEARGSGAAGRMLDAILARPICAGVDSLQATVTPDNTASWSAFRRFAARREAVMTASPWLVEGRHLPVGHADEHLITIGPLATPACAA